MGGFFPGGFFLDTSTPTPKKDALILDFSVIVNSQAAVTTAKTFNEISDGIIKFVENLSSGCSRIDILSDSYLDNCALVVDNFFPFTEATNIRKDFQGNF